jgi:hypothetical protein
MTSTAAERQAEYRQRRRRVYNAATELHRLIFERTTSGDTDAAKLLGIDAEDTLKKVMEYFKESSRDA